MGVSGQRHAPAALLPPVPIVQEAGWAPEPVWTQRLEKKILCPRRGSNLDRPVVQPVVRHYTAWANPAPENSLYPNIYPKLKLITCAFQQFKYHVSMEIQAQLTEGFFK
jgi:predicted amidophosphoribosyltransferase